jgi:hypothetical protein
MKTPTHRRWALSVLTAFAMSACTDAATDADASQRDGGDDASATMPSKPDHQVDASAPDAGANPDNDLDAALQDDAAALDDGGLNEDAGISEDAGTSEDGGASEDAGTGDNTSLAAEILGPDLVPLPLELEADLFPPPEAEFPRDLLPPP